jgi:uncharacterized protein with PIN domain
MVESDPKFACDDHCGRLARWLRVLGFDCAHDQEINDADLLKLALDENRTILTRDSYLAANALARRVILLSSSDPLMQLVEVIGEANLSVREDRLFTRCSTCNTPTASVAKETIADRLPPYVRRTRDVFRLCPVCNRIYWRATHVAHMLGRLREAGITLSE